MYTYVVDGEVTRLGSLPASWNRTDGTSVSNYDTLTDAEVKVDGWYPLTETRPTLEVGEQHGAPVYNIGADEVTAVYPVEPEPTEVLNRRDLETKLSDLIADAAAAISALQTIRDRTDLAAGTLTTAVLSGAARQLQADSKQTAFLAQEHIKRTVALARLTLGALETVENT